MSEQSRVKFERVICKNNSRNIKKNENGEYELSPIAYAYSGWQSATAEANKRIAELEGEVAELKGEKVRHDQLVDYLKAGIAEELEQRILELQANNNDLREALSAIRVWCEGPDTDLEDSIGKLACEALSATPAESLQAK